jgi:FkbM family methyltransferase
MTEFVFLCWRWLRWRVHLFGTLFLDRRHYAVTRRSRFQESLDELIDKPDFFFIQVGANDGVRFDELYQRVTRVNPRGIVIEPLPRYFARLKMNYEDYPGVTAVNAALHPTDTFVDIHHVDPEKAIAAGLPAWAGGIGSLLTDHHKRIEVPESCMTTTRVPALSFARLLDEHSVQHVDLLQIDAEGFDYEVLRMFPFERLKPLLIKYEHDGLDADARQAAKNLLMKHGYAVFTEGEDTVATLPQTGRREPNRPR